LSGTRNARTIISVTHSLVSHFFLHGGS